MLVPSDESLVLAMLALNSELQLESGPRIAREFALVSRKEGARAWLVAKKNVICNDAVCYFDEENVRIASLILLKKKKKEIERSSMSGINVLGSILKRCAPRDVISRAAEQLYTVLLAVQETFQLCEKHSSAIESANRYYALMQELGLLQSRIVRTEQIDDALIQARNELRKNLVEAGDTLIREASSEQIESTIARLDASITSLEEMNVGDVELADVSIALEAYARWSTPEAMPEVDLAQQSVRELLPHFSELTQMLSELGSNLDREAQRLSEFGEQLTRKCKSTARTIRQYVGKIAEKQRLKAASVPVVSMRGAALSALQQLRRSASLLANVQQLLAHIEEDVTAAREWLSADPMDLVNQIDELLDERSRKETEHILQERARRPDPEKIKQAHEQFRIVSLQVESLRSKAYRVFLQHFPELLRHESVKEIIDGTDLLKQDRTLAFYDGKPEPLNDRVLRVQLNGQPFVLKRYTLQESDMKRLMREVQLLQHLRSDLIVQITALFYDGTNAYIEMPFYSGGTVSAWLDAKRSALEANKTLSATITRLAHELVSAVAFLHENGVVHCDVKPDNVFVGADDRSRLGDFDVSKASSERVNAAISNLKTLTRLHSAGTAMFAAPELMSDSVSNTFASDIYSCGLVILELIRPGIASKRPIDLRSIGSADLRQLLDLASKMISDNPSSRPSAPQALRHECFARLEMQRGLHTPLYWNALPDDERTTCVDVTKGMRDQFQEMMDASSVWVNPNNPKDCRLGQDAAHTIIAHKWENDGLRHGGFIVERVLRVENTQLWRNYENTRNNITKAMLSDARKGIITKPVRTEMGRDWHADLLGIHGDPSSGNEALLAHGTNLAALNKIIHEGFDQRVSEPGLFGYGTYFAENPSKSDEYASPTNDVHVMIFARVLLGVPFVHEGAARGTEVLVLPGKERHIRSILRAPYLENRQRAADSLHHIASRVSGKPSWPWKCSEYIAYHGMQAYPEFVVEYKRVPI